MQVQMDSRQLYKAAEYLENFDLGKGLDSLWNRY